MTTAAIIGKLQNPELAAKRTPTNHTPCIEAFSLTVPSSIAVGKKVKRTGEASLFNDQTGKLTDEAFVCCKTLGIDPRELV